MHPQSGIFLFLVASWCKKDQILSSFSLSRLHIISKSGLFSHEQPSFLINEYISLLIKEKAESSNFVDKEEEANSKELKNEAMNPMATTVTMLGLTTKLVMISLEALKDLLLLDCLYFCSIERLTNSFGHVWDLCFGI